MSLTISRILHAGYVFACAGTRIAFDPIFENPFSRNCHAYPGVAFDRDSIRQLRFDAVFISHYHDDHCSMESLDLLARDTPIYLYCIHDAMFALIRQLGFTDVHALRTNLAIDVGNISVTPVEAFDADVDAIFHIRAAGLNVLNVVDAWIGDEVLDILAKIAWDMVLWPFQTMREIDVLAPAMAVPAERQSPPELMAQLAMLRPRYVVPSSCQFIQEPWSWYRLAYFPISYRQFEADVAAHVPGTQVLRMNPSVSFVLDAVGVQPAAPLAWVLPVGEQQVDYAYEASVAAPATASIARNFPPLAAAQSAQVLNYCETGLLQRYPTLELPEESYFGIARHWQLSVYDDEGVATHWYYRVQGDTLARADAGPALPAWRTEVPAAKLYAALALGETLSSMYLRINDGALDPQTAAERAEADVMDDPLIRCLFTDVFGAYQAAQLRRLAAQA